MAARVAARRALSVSGRAQRSVAERSLREAPASSSPSPAAAGGAAEVQMSTLSNGVRVASKNLPGVWGNITGATARKREREG